MADLISRAAAIGCLGNSPEQMCMPWSEVERMLRELPAVDAMPVEWLIDRANDPERAPLYRRYAQMLYEEWQKEQEAQDAEPKTT